MSGTNLWFASYPLMRHFTFRSLLRESNVVVLCLFLATGCAPSPEPPGNKVLVDDGPAIDTSEAGADKPAQLIQDRPPADLYYSAKTNTLQVNPEHVEAALEYFKVSVTPEGFWEFLLGDTEISVKPILIIPHAPIRPYPPADDATTQLGDYVWMVDCRCSSVTSPGGCVSIDEGGSSKWDDGQSRTYGVCASTSTGGCLEVVTSLGNAMHYSRPGCNEADLESVKNQLAWVCLEL